MKNTLLIFLLSLITVSSFAQQKFSRADSLILARIDTLGPFTGTYFMHSNGRVITHLKNVLWWPCEVLVDSFAGKMEDVKGVFDFVNANTPLLYRYFGNNDIYLVAITNKEAIGVVVGDGKPRIDYRGKTTSTLHCYYGAPIYFIKRAP